MIEEENHNLIVRGFPEATSMTPKDAVQRILERIFSEEEDRESYKHCTLNVVKINGRMDRLHLMILNFTSPYLKTPSLAKSTRKAN